LSACPSDSEFFNKLANGLAGVGWLRARVGLAVSGGADSVALAVAFSEFAPPGVHIEILHVNHGLRGRASGNDARFVRAMAKKLGYPFRLKKIQPLAKKPGEGQLRNARYAAFVEMAREGKLRYILTAHTADDQAETVVHNIARGAGLAGLAGIPRRRFISKRPPIEVLRPMLRIARDEILAFLRSRRIGWREDVTNASLDYTRNRLRHVVLPALERHVNPAASQRIASLAVLADEARDYIAGEARKLLPKKISGSVALEIKILREAPAALAREAVFQVARAVTSPGTQVTSERVDAALSLIHSPCGAKSVELGGGGFVTREFSRLVFTKGAPKTLRLPTAPAQLRPARSVKWGDWKISAKTPAPGKFNLKRFLSRKNESMEAFDADECALPLLVRSRKPGDRITIAGGKTKKLKAVLSEAKIPARRRNEVPVITDSQGRILWGAPIRRSATALCTSNTKNILVVSVSAFK